MSQPDYNSREVIDTIKATVAKNASDAELAMFLEVCKSTGLNPFLKEIWCAIPMKNGVRNPYGQVLIMASRDGYLRVANEHPMFDGIDTRVERNEETKIPIKATCTVWRKDRNHPTVCEAYFSEYYKPGAYDKPGIWDIYKSAMIGKVAEVLALKRSFSINGTVTEEELGQNPLLLESGGSVAAAQAVAKQKMATYAARAEADDGLGVSPEDTQIDPRADLLDAIKKEGSRVVAAAVAFEDVKSANTIAMKAAFGISSWKAIVDLPLEALSKGLETLRAMEAWKAPEPELEPIWSDKISMRKDFGKQKERLIALVGDEQGQREYYAVLEKHGAKKSTSFDADLPAAMRCFVELRALIPVKKFPPVE